MASAYSTKVAEGFSQRLLKEMYDKNLANEIVNRDYEGEINEVGSKLNILNFARISEKTYANAAMSADSLYENNATLTIDQYKSFYWKEKTLARWLSYIKNPHATIVAQKADERSANIDHFIFDKYSDVGGGNWVGTSYTTGTVTVAATTGVVTGSGTTFTSSMVGKPFKADGHSYWYRVSAYSSATSITIEDDLDDTTSAYTGGAIAGGSTYEIQANTVVSITTANLLQYVGKLKLALDTVERFGYSSVPDSGRWLVVPPEFESTLVRATGVALHVPEAYQELVKKGFITQLQGFNVFKSNRLNGDNTNGFYVLAGHGNWMTFAEKQLEATIEEDLIGDFGSAYKDLFVYGAKVADARRHMAALLYCTFA
jgi:hypothetical protein